MLPNGGTSTSHGNGLTAGEFEVCEILPSLPCLINSSNRWATKKKRSNSSRSRRLLLQAPPAIEANASSPTTPLGLIVEFDEKSNNATKKIPKRKNIEELREEVVRLEKRRKIYTEVGNHNQEPPEIVVVNHKQNLLPYGETLRAKRLEILHLIFDETPEEIRPKTCVPCVSGDQHQIQVNDEHGSSAVVQFSNPISQVGPSFPSRSVQIPDLNLPATEPLDLAMETSCYRAEIAALARRTRMLTLKEKRKKRMMLIMEEKKIHL